MEGAYLAERFAEDDPVGDVDELAVDVDVKPGTYRRAGGDRGWTVETGKTVDVTVSVKVAATGARYGDKRIQLTVGGKDYRGKGPHAITLPSRDADWTMKIRAVLSDGKTHVLSRRTLWIRAATTATTTSSTEDALRKEKQKLDKVIADARSTFSDVAAAYTRLQLVEHRLAIATTGVGLYEGTQCATPHADATATDCTQIVTKVLQLTLDRLGRKDTWKKLHEKAKKAMEARGARKLSGVDYQIALQDIEGWTGIYWSPDPAYQIPDAELEGAKPSEANFTHGFAKKGTYYKDWHVDGKTKGYPGLAIAHVVVDYAPEAPNAGFGDASKTVATTSQLTKLAKLRFGVLSAHGGFHMTIISDGKVIEVHWDKEATDPDVIEETDFATWAIGPISGFHYYASGAIVAPKSDVAAAFP